MKTLFSKTWNKSAQPRKQRKYRHNAPIHTARKFLSAHLSKHLRKEYGRRSAKLRLDDLVKVVRGNYAGTEGKVTKMDALESKVYISGISLKKAGGKQSFVPIQASNVMIIELNMADAKRVAALKKNAAGNVSAPSQGKGAKADAAKNAKSGDAKQKPAEAAK